MYLTFGYVRLRAWLHGLTRWGLAYVCLRA
jgi:hypothetical protein